MRAITTSTSIAIFVLTLSACSSGGTTSGGQASSTSSDASPSSSARTAKSASVSDGPCAKFGGTGRGLVSSPCVVDIDPPLTIKRVGTDLDDPPKCEITNHGEAAVTWYSFSYYYYDDRGTLLAVDSFDHKIKTKANLVSTTPAHPLAAGATSTERCGAKKELVPGAASMEVEIQGWASGAPEMFFEHKKRGLDMLRPKGGYR